MLAGNSASLQNSIMRALAMVLVAAAILYGVYEVYLKRMPTTDAGTAPTQAISLTGVRSDLLQIAQAERSNVALNGKCASLDELISSGAITMNKRERDDSQQKFMDSSELVMVATNAFGLGVDKANIRNVLHYHVPASWA